MADNHATGCSEFKPTGCTDVKPITTLHGSGRYQFGDIYMFRQNAEDVWQDPNLSNLDKWFKIFLYEDLGSDEFKSSLREIYDLVVDSSLFRQRELIVETNMMKLANSEGHDYETSPDTRDQLGPSLG